MNRRLPVDAALMSQVRALLARRDDRPLPAGHARPEMKVSAQADGGAEMFIYDEISYWGICATDVAAALATVSGDLTVRINSPGGDVFDGVAIYNLLADYPGQVHVVVDGLAASAASFIAQAGDTITMNRAAQMMIHDASGMCWGNTADMRAMAALLDMLSGTIAGIYAARSGVDADTWRERMLADGGVGTWFTAEAAVEAGLADGLVAMAERPDESAESAAATAGQEMAALFPYGTNDASGRWQLAALAPQTGGIVANPPVTGEAGPPPTIHVNVAGSIRSDQELVQIIAAAVRKHGGGIAVAAPVASEADPADADHAAPAPQDIPAEPDPAPVAATAEVQPTETEPDDWARLIEPLTAEPSAEDLLASLREA